MSRRRRATKNPHKPDSRYNSPLVSQLINVVMKNGKKTVAQRIVYGAIERVSEKLEKGDPMELLLGALENCRPKLEVKSRRVGGATYQVPVEVEPERQVALAMRWIVTYSRSRKGKSMTESLAGELLDAFNNTGSSIKKKEDTYKMAQANKAFAHYRW